MNGLSSSMHLPLCFTVSSMFPAVSIKHPSEGLSFEQEAAPSPQGLRSQSRRELARPWLFISFAADGKVSFVRPVFVKALLAFLSKH